MITHQVAGWSVVVMQRPAQGGPFIGWRYSPPMDRAFFRTRAEARVYAKGGGSGRWDSWRVVRATLSLEVDTPIP